MQRLTQTGENCWQTCVAMVLDVDVSTLPDQEVTSGRDTARYAHVLREYLYKHHDLTYFEVSPEEFAALARQSGVLHIMMGDTVRTSENGVWHAVVAVSGEIVWDPHPSRAGLVTVRKWGIFVPFPDHWRGEWGPRELRPCLCPTCAPTETVRAA